jgi:argininosuccinate lyase
VTWSMHDSLDDEMDAEFRRAHERIAAVAADVEADRQNLAEIDRERREGAVPDAELLAAMEAVKREAARRRLCLECDQRCSGDSCRCWDDE